MLVTDEQVRSHLRIAVDEDVSVYVMAAESMAAQFLNRNVYATEEDLTAAIAAAPSSLDAAVTAYDLAMDAAAALGCVQREGAQFIANEQMNEAVAQNRRVALGMVANDLIRAAILLTIGHLYANREEVVVGASVAELPMSSKYLLQPYRKQMGV